jgi:transposase
MLIEPVPPEAVRVARAAFSKGHRYPRLADELDTLFTDEAFLALFPTHGQPAQPPWRLALVTILQFAEGPSDRQAANAVRSRIDWQYVLRLELTDAGFDASVLSEFRTRLLAGDGEYLLFDTLLTWCCDRQLVKAGGRQRTDHRRLLALQLAHIDFLDEQLDAPSAEIMRDLSELEADALPPPPANLARATGEVGSEASQKAPPVLLGPLPRPSPC